MCRVALWSVFVFGITAAVQAIAGNPEHAGYHYAKLKREVTKEPLPYLVKLGYKTQYGDIWACAGALVDRKKVVTTTTCTTLKPFRGDLNIVQVQDKNFTIAKIESQGEVAVLLLDRPVDFVKDLACLSPNSAVSTAISAGWGGLLFDNQLHGTINKEMSQIRVTVFEVTNDIIKVRPTQGSPCVADRGGPLQSPGRTSGCRYFVIGVVRDWSNCGESGSIGTYLSLASYIGWIENL